MIFAILIGVLAGIVSATKQYSVADYSVMGIGTFRNFHASVLAWNHVDDDIWSIPWMASNRRTHRSITSLSAYHGFL